MAGYVKEKVRDIIINQLVIPINEMKENGHLVKDYNMDAIDLNELILALEEEFDICIHDDVAHEWVYVYDVIKGVEEAINNKGVAK